MGRGLRALAVAGTVVAALAAVVVPEAAAARSPYVSYRGTVAGQTTTPARTAALPGDVVVAALTDCAADERDLGLYGRGVLLPADAEGRFAGELVSGCDYRVVVSTNPCGAGGTLSPQLPVEARRAPIRARYVVPVADPAGQPREPDGDPSPGETVVVVDAARGIDAWPCVFSSDRTIRTTVMVPDGDGPFPLVILGHGLGNTRWTVHETAKGYPPRGYVVAAPTFPMVAVGQDPSRFTAPDLPNQPGDVSVLLDDLLRRSADPEDSLHGKIDPARIGYEGVSGGAITGLLFLNTCCDDPRIDAVSAGMGYFLPTGFVGGRYRLQPGASPALHMANNSDDELIPFDSALAGWEGAQPDKFLAFGSDDDGCAWSHCIPAGVGAGAEYFVDAYVKGDLYARAALVDLFSTSTDTVTRRFQLTG